jgi:hypothetical protein
LRDGDRPSSSSRGSRPPPGEERGHGASPTVAMTHLAIREALDGVAVAWLEHVSDEPYAG